MASLTDEELTAIAYDWSFWARPEQLTPGGRFRWWLILAGRGWGKTRTGAEFIKQRIVTGKGKHIGIVGATSGDVRRTMLYGESGLRSVFPPDVQFLHEPSKTTVTFPEDYPGVTITCYSGDQPEQLRGPQHDTLWIDELAKMRRGRDVMSNAELGLRLGHDPCGAITTTPRPTDEIRALLADPDVVVAGKGNQRAMHTDANAGNLPESFFRRVYSQYAGTRLGRQELQAILDERTPGALWWTDLLERTRVPEMPEGVYPTRTVVGVDPATSSPERDFDIAEYEEKGKAHPEIGIVVASRGRDGHCYVRFDASVWDTPERWAARVGETWRLMNADLIVAEKNQGGALVEANIRGYGANLPIKLVWASDGKRTRAEPVAMLYERGLIHHVGPAENFARLESQLCGWVPGTTLNSPDRLDALVWAVWELMLDGTDFQVPACGPRIARPRGLELHQVRDHSGEVLGPAAAFSIVIGQLATLDTLQRGGW